MTRVERRPRRSLSLLLALTAVIAAIPAGAQQEDHEPITRQLIELVESQPEVGGMLAASIAAAKAVNPDPVTNPAQSLGEYYDFVDEASKLIPRHVMENPPDLIRDQILQSICYFYFLVDQPLPQLEGKGLYDNTIQYYGPFSDWLRSFADAWGAFLDTEASWSEESYEQFAADPSYGLQKGWYEAASNWNTFNRFFARYLASPSARPIAAPDDPTVVASPADSVPQGTWAIDEQSRIQVDGGLDVKLATFYSIEELLGEESAYRDAFANGTLTHTFLNVNDYHRFHFAVGGTVREKRLIAANVALEVRWDGERGVYDPIDSTGWQFTQTRGYVIVETEEHGLVALVPMGMAQVSSVLFEDDVTVGSVHEKGDMLGNFLFGGSDFVMVFQERADFELTAPEETESAGGSEPTYRHLLMGEAFGRLGAQP